MADVNFRIVEVERETEDGRHEPALLLDFNVEGNIWGKDVINHLQTWTGGDILL